jgi:uncharacterized protein DUF4333
MVERPVSAKALGSRGSHYPNWEERRMIRSLRAPLLALCAVLALTGLTACGTTKVKGSDVSKDIESDVLEPRGIDNATVTCPDETEAKKDATIKCTVKADGENGEVTATMTNDDGDLGDFKPDVEDIQRKVIEDNAAQEGASKGITGDVKCPAGTPKDGAVFFCTAEIRGSTGVVIVTQTDEESNVTVKVPQRNLTTAKIERQIEKLLAKQDITATATCPAKVKLKVGATFECSVEATNGRSITVVATQKDEKGNVGLKVK